MADLYVCPCCGGVEECSRAASRAVPPAARPDAPSAERIIAALFARFPVPERTSEIGAAVQAAIHEAASLSCPWAFVPHHHAGDAVYARQDAERAALLKEIAYERSRGFGAATFDLDRLARSLAPPGTPATEAPGAGRFLCGNCDTRGWASTGWRAEVIGDGVIRLVCGTCGTATGPLVSRPAPAALSPEAPPVTTDAFYGEGTFKVSVAKCAQIRADGKCAGVACPECPAAASPETADTADPTKEE